MLGMMFALFYIAFFVGLPAFFGYVLSRRSASWVVAAAISSGLLLWFLFDGNIHTDPFPLLFLPGSIALGSGAALQLVMQYLVKRDRGA